MDKIEGLFKRSWFIWIGLAVVLISLPLIKPGFFISDDGDWMVIRLSAFYQSLREGQFPVRFLGRLNHGYGYPVANFLYPGFLYLGSLIHVFGVPFPDVVKLLFILAVTGTSFFLYLWLRYDAGCFASTLGAISFVFAPYVLYDIYKRGSIGEILAFFPVSAALYSIRSNRRWILPLAIALLIVSHNSLALLFILYLTVYVLVYGKKEYFVSMLIGIGMSSFFWFPALWERQYVTFDALKIAESKEYFLRGQMLSLIGLPFLAACFILLFRRLKQIPKRAFFFLLTFIISIVLALPISSFIWTIPFFPSFIQFPYRMLAITVISGVWLVAMSIHIYPKHKEISNLSVIVTFFILSLVYSIQQITSVASVDRPVTYYTTNEATTTVADEYMPRWIGNKPIHRASDRVEVHKGDATIAINFVSTQRYDVTIDAKDTSIVQLNTIYYPGWGAMVDDVPVAIDYKNDQGVMYIPIVKGKHRVVAEFRETIPRFIADCVSVLFLGLYIATVTSWKNNKK